MSRATRERKGTADQRRAIDTVGTDLCVVAGAGTGKTFVLTERLVKRVVDDRLDLRQVLAITFTEKAAAEMKERLAAALEAAGMAGARAAVDAAAISTVHAFCARLLREHAVAAGVDPGFAVLDEIESDRLLREALDRLVDEWRENDAADFETLAALGGDDPAETLIDVYREAQASGRALGEFVRAVGDLPAAGPLVARVRDSVAALRPLAGTGTAAAQRNVAAAIAAGASLPRDAATDGTSDAGIERAVAAIDAATKINCGEPAKSALVAVRDAAREALPVLAEHAMRPLRDVLARAVERLDALYDDEKGRGERLDFADLERRAVALLETRADVRDDVRARRPEVLVDEFQDTNPVQARLVDLLRTPDRLFVVGDPKQAIYGFRGADVSVFQDRLRAVDAAGRGGVVPLQHSFRSRPEILGFVNRLFAGGVAQSDGARPGMFDTETQRHGGTENGGDEGERRKAAGRPGADEHAHADADVASDVRLVAGRAWAAAAEPAVDLHVVQAPSMPEGREAEARWIADRIVALVESGFRIGAPTKEDALATRPADFGDFAVLMRATTHVKILEQALVGRDVPYLVVKGRGFFRAREVIDVAHLLACVENPRDDLALAAVLRSPACGLSDDGLFALTSKRREDFALIDVVHAWAADETAAPGVPADGPADEAFALRRFVGVFDDLRARRATDGVAALVERAFDRTRIDVLALGRPNGRQRAANLRKVRTLAREADAEGLSLREFVDELKTLRAREVREAEASVAGGARGAVSLMSVHAAKGLEFPVVFVPDVGRSEIHRGERVVADVRGGVGLRGWAGAAHDAKPWLYAHLSERKKAAEMAESERLLYVAVTRAADHLVLTGVLTERGDSDGRPRVWWDKVSAATGIDAPPAEDVDRDVGPAADGACDVHASVGAPGTPMRRAVVRVHAPTPASGVPAAVAKTLLGRVATQLAAGVVPALQLREESRREAAALLDEAVRRPPLPDGTPYATNVSALTAFARCPQEYRLRYVVGVPEDEGTSLFGARTAFDVDEAAPGDEERGGDDEFLDGTPSDAGPGASADSEPSTRALGRAAHAALEHLVPAFATEIVPEVESALRAETGGGAPDPREVARLAGWIERFRESEIGCDVAAAPRADVRREQAFLLRAGRTVVRGQVDLLWRGPRGWNVVDYKTGALTAARPENELQMRLYALGVRAVTGTLPSRLALWSLPFARAVDVACGPGDVAAVEALLTGFSERTARSAFEPGAIPPCPACRVRAACRFAPR